MKRGILWLMVGWLIVLALVLVSCGPAAPPGEQEEEEEEEEEAEEEEAPTLSIGETFQTPGVVVTVSELIVTDSYEYHDTFSGEVATKEARPGMFFLIFTVEIENVDMGYFGRFVGNDGIDKLVYKRYWILLAVDGCRLPVKRVPFVDHVRTSDILLKHKWSGANQVLPIRSTGLYHFRSILLIDPTCGNLPLPASSIVIGFKNTSVSVCGSYGLYPSKVLSPLCSTS